MIKKICICFTNYIKKKLKYKGDSIDGLYNHNDSNDETELINMLSCDNIIHPFVDDACVIFNNNRYSKLATSPSPPSSPPPSSPPPSSPPPSTPPSSPSSPNPSNIDTLISNQIINYLNEPIEIKYSDSPDFQENSIIANDHKNKNLTEPTQINDKSISDITCILDQDSQSEVFCDALEYNDI